MSDMQGFYHSELALYSDERLPNKKKKVKLLRCSNHGLNYYDWQGEFLVNKPGVNGGGDYVYNQLDLKFFIARFNEEFSGSSFSW